MKSRSSGLKKLRSVREGCQETITDQRVIIARNVSGRSAVWPDERSETLLGTAWVRPQVGYQLVREFTYAYGAVSPSDGVSDFLILPYMNAELMSLFLAEIARRHPQEYIFMLYDGAPCHSPTALVIPENMMVKTLPPYCPELNPTEHIWDEIREKFFPNLVFESLAAVENKLVEAILYLENNPSVVQSITGFQWIIKSLAKI